jgi:hypothetical protein
MLVDALLKNSSSRRNVGGLPETGLQLGQECFLDPITMQLLH